MVPHYNTRHLLLAVDIVTAGGLAVCWNLGHIPGHDSIESVHFGRHGHRLARRMEEVHMVIARRDSRLVSGRTGFDQDGTVAFDNRCLRIAT